MRTYLIALLIVALQPAAASAQEPRAAYLSQKELRSLLSNRLTVRFEGFTRTGTAIYEKDGTVRLDGGNWTDVGSWRIEGDKFCTNYTSTGSTCFHVQKTGAKSYKLFPTDGQAPGTWVVK